MPTLECQPRELCPPHASDGQLCAAIAYGDRDAFWLLWERHENRLLRACRAIMGQSFDDADDALASARLRAYAKFPEVSGRMSNPSGWLMQLTRNLCIDMKRARRKRDSRSVDFDEATFEIADPRVDADPMRAAIANDRHERIISLLQRLPADAQTVWRMRFAQEMDYKEIAAATNMREATIRKRVQLMRDLIRETLSRDYAAA